MKKERGRCLGRMIKEADVGRIVGRRENRRKAKETEGGRRERRREGEEEGQMDGWVAGCPFITLPTAIL